MLKKSILGNKRWSINFDIPEDRYVIDNEDRKFLAEIISLVSLIIKINRCEYAVLHIKLCTDLTYKEMLPYLSKIRDDKTEGMTEEEMRKDLELFLEEEKEILAKLKEEKIVADEATVEDINKEILSSQKTIYKTNQKLGKFHTYYKKMNKPIISPETGWRSVAAIYSDAIKKLRKDAIVTKMLEELLSEIITD